MRYLLLIILLAGTACKEQLEIECDDDPQLCEEILRGTSGDDGEDGEDAPAAKPVTVEITVDRSKSWTTSNLVELDFYGVVFLPKSFEVPELQQNENGGWLDFKVGEEVYCYQGEIGKKSYKFKYRKLSTAVLGCDTNSEKDTTYTNFDVAVAEGDTFQIVPRAPRFSGIVVKFEFSGLGIIDN